MASARWLSKVLGLMFIRKAPCLLEHPSLIRLSTFALAPGQRLLTGLRGEHQARLAVSVPAADGQALRARFVIGIRRRMIGRHLLDHRADAFGLLKRVLHHLLQIGTIARRLGELMAVLLDLVHVEQQRCQRPVQLPGNCRPRLVHRPGARGRELDDFMMVFERRDGVHPL